MTEDEMNDYIPDEVMAMMFPEAKRVNSSVCAECGEEILPSNIKFWDGNNRIHEKCYKPSNVIPLIPIGCEDMV